MIVANVLHCWALENQMPFVPHRRGAALLAMPCLEYCHARPLPPAECCTHWGWQPEIVDSCQSAATSAADGKSAMSPMSRWARPTARSHGTPGHSCTRLSSNSHKMICRTAKLCPAEIVTSSCMTAHPMQLDTARQFRRCRRTRQRTTARRNMESAKGDSHLRQPWRP